MAPYLGGPLPDLFYSAPPNKTNRDATMGFGIPSNASRIRGVEKFDGGSFSVQLTSFIDYWNLGFVTLLCDWYMFWVVFSSCRFSDVTDRDRNVPSFTRCLCLGSKLKRSIPFRIDKVLCGGIRIVHYTRDPRGRGMPPVVGSPARLLILLPLPLLRDRHCAPRRVLSHTHINRHCGRMRTRESAASLINPACHELYSSVHVDPQSRHFGTWGFYF